MLSLLTGMPVISFDKPCPALLRMVMELLIPS